MTVEVRSRRPPIKQPGSPNEVQLRLVHDSEPGLHRDGSPGKFTYSDADGSRVCDEAVLGRIRRLAIPPAWITVWIAPYPDAHLQATGFDRRGRKQYRYHEQWRTDRDHLKFLDMEGFARAQSLVRGKIEVALRAGEGTLEHRRVLALSLRLLDIGLLRVGSDRYARDNQHYRLTTLRRDQVTLRHDEAVFDYIGKAGKSHRTAISDPQAIDALRDLKRRRQGPDELLVYRGPRGWGRVHREDVNNFLRAESGGPYSAKEYRTWNATVIAAATLAARRPGRSHAASVASTAVAQALGNTPAVAQRSYIDPRVLERFAAGRAIALTRLPTDPWQARKRVESRVLELLDS